MADFTLEKWYMDATDEDGNALISYSARLTWGPVRLRYNGYTFYRKHTNTIHKKSSFSSGKLPVITPGKLSWKFSDVKGTWISADSEVHEQLLQTESGSINWSCYQPKAIADIQFGDLVLNKPYGYTEKIIITLFPWKLPIKELHWGRFLSSTDTVIWIRWIGTMPKQLVFHNGERITDVTIHADLLEFGAYKLHLRQPVSLRKGTVLETVFKKFPAVARLFPATIVQLQEDKWLSEGVLKIDNKIVSSGKAIHEIVRWP